jgi:23S rRNA (uracil1939-C5)-methyltransferase
LREQLERNGYLKDVPPVDIVATPEHCWHYRNQIQFHLTLDGKLGFQKARSNETITVPGCYLSEASINRLWPLIDIEPVHGLARIGLRSGVDKGMMLILEC